MEMERSRNRERARRWFGRAGVACANSGRDSACAEGAAVLAVDMLKALKKKLTGERASRQLARKARGESGCLAKRQVEGREQREARRRKEIETTIEEERRWFQHKRTNQDE